MRRELPEINAGSMADIAFLLLIFFLVTTIIETDKGIFTKLPKKDDQEQIITFKDKNILDVIINPNNELLVENEVIEIPQLTEIAKTFIDNGGGTDRDGKKCTWCKGLQNPKSSDHPSKALIAIDANRVAHYGTYIQVLDHIHKAYAELRDRYAREVHQMSYKAMVKDEKDNVGNRDVLREKIKDVRSKYPLLVTDSQIQE